MQRHGGRIEAIPWCTLALNNLCESMRVTMMITYRPGACGVYVSRLASLENVFSPPF